jgi:glucokinase
MEDARYIGIDIGGTKTAVSAGTEHGELRFSYSFPTKDHYTDVLEDIYAQLDKLFERIGDQAQVIGVSCGGPLDSREGVILSPPNLPSWRDVPIVSLLEKRYDRPAFLENDANACALAEWYWGSGKGYEHMLFLTFGTGLGAGLILGGELYRGANGLSGEIGHVRMASEGPYCYRKHGSWESFCSGSGISELYRRERGELLSAKQVCERAEAGDADARRVIDVSAEYLGRGLAMLIDIFNPEAVIIGSIFTRSEALFRDAVEKIIAEEALNQPAETCRILTSSLGDRLGDYAALGVAINGFKHTRNEE